ncbi:MAG: protein phosphatase CheZ [Candidatus Zixiibacteriota bacterium]
MTDTQDIYGRLQSELSSIALSVSGLLEAVRQIREPLVESQQKVPQATNQLDKISAQTEAAAHRMLDVVEHITQREEDVITGLAQLIAMIDARQQADVAMLITAIRQKAESNLNDAYAIMEALQFQDITSQQMNHAASLLEDIEDRLQNILGGFGPGGSSASGEDPARTRPTRAFDPHADLANKQARQTDIDSMFAKAKSR